MLKYKIDRVLKDKILPLLDDAPYKAVVTLLSKQDEEGVIALDEKELNDLFAFLAGKPYRMVSGVIHELSTLYQMTNMNSAQPPAKPAAAGTSDPQDTKSENIPDADPEKA